MNQTLSFRNAMAEEGFEYTPDQAEEAIEAVETFRQQIHDRCREDPEQYENLKNLSDEEKRTLCREMAENGHETTPEELDQYIRLVLEVYEQEKMF